MPREITNGYYEVEEYERAPFPPSNDAGEVFIYIEKAMDVWMGRQLYHVYHAVEGVGATGTKEMTCDAATIQTWGAYAIKFEKVFPKEVSNA